MRSRYTAFAVGDPAHLFRTWHPRSRPAEVDLPPAVTWTGLEVLDVVDGGVGDQVGVVEFRASWTGAGPPTQRGALHERSRFARRAGRWLYLDGQALP